MIKIKLNHGVWEYDLNNPIGKEGGFGIVYVGKSELHDNLAVKKLKIDAKEAAHRELEIAEELSGRELEHVITIYDSGLDAESDSYFIIMDRAEKSLQDEIESKNKLDDLEAVKILLDIATGLEEVSDIIHRDLKPDNVLYHDGKWKVSDFGIAKFVEESTSLRTLRTCLTPYYAAPEQWNLERTSNATDIYALGCIGYALLKGALRPKAHR